MTLVNRYGYLVFAGAALAVAWVASERNGLLVQLLSAGALAIVLFVVWLVLRPRERSVRELAELDRHRGAGRPIVLDFVSPF